MCLLTPGWLGSPFLPFAEKVDGRYKEWDKGPCDDSKMVSRRLIYLIFSRIFVALVYTLRNGLLDRFLGRFWPRSSPQRPINTLTVAQHAAHLHQIRPFGLSLPLLHLASTSLPPQTIHRTLPQGNMDHQNCSGTCCERDGPTSNNNSNNVRRHALMPLLTPGGLGSPFPFAETVDGRYKEWGKRSCDNFDCGMGRVISVAQKCSQDAVRLVDSREGTQSC